MNPHTHPPGPGPPRVLVLAVAAVLTLTACTGPTDQTLEEGSTETTEPSPSPEEAEPFTVAFGGDVMFDGVLADRLASDPETTIGPVSDVFAQSDLSMVNLETAVTEGGTEASGKAFTFRAPPSAYTALKSANIDVATVANNHGMDYGPEGLADTLDHAEDAGFPLVGIGRDAERAYAPQEFDVNGNTVAILGATDVMNTNLIQEWTAGDDQPGLASVKNGSLERMLEAVGAADERADTVITYLHKGVEGEHCPPPRTRDLVRQLVDAGSDVVVGSHAHVLGPGGHLDGAYVHYGLGNFVFYNFSGPTAETGVLRLTLQEGEVLDDEWLPGRIRGGIPTLYEGERASEATETWKDYRESCDVRVGSAP
ncbi:CapA family protein [Halostreptopolyspora alba]|uniref:CapA family protein n=1 Tax=Halostreptopolyspora alba TaxID=2487137 RepID=A0A3N0EIG7_9ACTN|nr:CapA family protein [Nocardiopsaceae bacterium YIM 96095]